MASKFIEKIKTTYNTILDRFLAWWDRVFVRLPKSIQDILAALKRSFTLFRAHDTASLGAGLSYYMVFSIAPMLIIVISITGSILGPEAVTGALKSQLESLMGSSTAKQIQDMVKAAYQPGKNWIATTLSIILLITGAVGVFDQLRSALNAVWDVKPGEKKPFWRYLIQRVFSFGMIACIAFLLLVSLVINAGIAALSVYINEFVPDISKIIAYFFELIISFSLTTILFAFIYKFMSDIKMKWRNVWVGAIFTSLLFAIGKYLIGLYIGQSHIANTYGAASSVIVVLLWVYYSSQIVFFGAEFTRALADEKGIHIEGIAPAVIPPAQK